MIVQSGVMFAVPLCGWSHCHRVGALELQQRPSAGVPEHALRATVREAAGRDPQVRCLPGNARHALARPSSWSPFARPGGLT